MKFKECVQNDLDVLINQSEFAETVAINNINVLVTEDNERLSYKIKKDYDGLIIGDTLFYITKKECVKISNFGPTANEAINYNGKPATIISSNYIDGLYEVIIQFVGIKR